MALSAIPDRILTVHDITIRTGALTARSRPNFYMTSSYSLEQYIGISESLPPRSYSFVLTMEAARFSATSAKFYQTTWRHISGDSAYCGDGF
jgi:hypothetical protein